MAYPDVCFIVAPREIKRGREVAEIFASHGLPAVLRSKDTPVGQETCCLIVDTMGELVYYYQLADIAFVGGSLRPFGGHNPLEPAAFGKPVLFGSHMEDFEDICAEMLQEECAVQVGSGVEFAQEIGVLLKDRQRCKELGQAGHDYIIKRQGVTQRHLVVIAQLLAGTC
jgi:3-deoxy-D-manno-octulosonic-acid transferase